MIVNENEKVDLSGIRYCSFLDTNIISSQYVKYQEAAVPPTDYEVERYKFIGWDQDFSSVTEDMLIKGIYEKEKAVIRFFNGKKALFDDYIRTKKLIKILKNKYRYDYNKIMKNESFIWNNIVY